MTNRVLRPNWSGERIYQETRKIVGAQLQVSFDDLTTLKTIIYFQDNNISWLATTCNWRRSKCVDRDILVRVFSLQGMRLLGPYRGYNQSMDPSITNVFATAAMRFGHTLINTPLIKKFVSNSTTSGHDMKLRKLFFASHMLYRPKLADSVLRGLLHMPLKKPMPEQAISSELTDHLFELSRQAPLDLASINTQRGRDHALPGYNQWRSFCGLNKAQTFDQFSNQITNAEIRTKLEQLYGHPDNVDLWVGAIMEKAGNDAKVGPTFRCLLADQFKKLRDGDRYFYKVTNRICCKSIH